MTIQVNAPFQVSDNLQALIDEKIGKLSTYFERIESAEVFFKDEEHHSNGSLEVNTAELKLLVPGHTLYAAETSESYEKSLTATAEKMRKQLIKHKEQLTPHL
jgi:ribosomal subunit interface protein